LKEDGVLMCRGRVSVPKLKDMKIILLREIHNVPYSMDPRYEKTFEPIRG
jgi:hypothetical protein